MRRGPLVLLVVCVTIAGTILVSASPAAAAPAWSIVSSPNPPSPPVGGFSGVTCITATNCFAVGSRDTLTLIERWNGTAWSVMTSANPPTASRSELSDVACTSATNCVAVGNATFGGSIKTLVEQWNGLAWSVVASPNANATSNHLSGVSCTSATNCFAVGDGNGVLVERWNGTTWTIVASPNPPGSGLYAVSCPSPTSCFAVGGYFIADGFDSRGATLVLEWDGSAWSQVPTPDQVPNPSGVTENILADVSCTSSTYCVAVGYYMKATGDFLDKLVHQTLIEAWDGADWSLVESPNAGDAQYNELLGVSCTSTTSCTAVGRHLDDSFASRTLAETWNGSTWSLAAGANGAASISALAGVSCTNAGECFAVGSAWTNAEKTLVERQSGSTWSIVPSPNAPGPTRAELDAVACTSATNCFAVGDGAGKALIERWNGTTWSVAATISGRLHGIACPSATSCFAVGDIGSNPLTARWSGAQWSVVPSPSPSGADMSTLASVSCPSATSCFAVGETTTGVTPKTLIERWNGSSWSIAVSPNPDDPIFATLKNVACSSTTSCMAVGSFQKFQQPIKTLSERWNGTSWGIVSSPNRGGASESTLSGISCVTAANCYAVGAAIVNNVKSSFVLRWNGSSWAGVLSSHPGGATASDLAGVSCKGATSCVAVGDYVSAGVTKTWAETWDGTNWKVNATPNPANSYVASFAGVSCLAGQACFAVGRFERGGQALTLTERYA
jgi:hypothetical protein